MRVYHIAHESAHQKATALASLKSLIRCLEIDLEPPIECCPVQRVKGANWESVIGHTRTVLSAVVRVHGGKQPELTLPFLTWWDTTTL